MAVRTFGLHYSVSVSPATFTSCGEGKGAMGMVSMVTACMFFFLFFFYSSGPPRAVTASVTDNKCTLSYSCVVVVSV